MDTTQRHDDLHVSRIEHEDSWTIAVDLHPLADDEVTVELLDETAVVAVDTPTVRTEFDLPLPDDSGTARLRNGVLVVESTA